MALVRFIRVDDVNNGITQDHDPSVDEINLLDVQLGGVALGINTPANVDGPSVINDDLSLYTNFTPLGNTLRDTLLAIDGAIGNISNEVCVEYTNGNAGAIAVGDAVYISGADTVDLADNGSVGTDDVIGVVKDTTIASAASGLICSEGVVEGAITGAGFSAGDKIYLSNAGTSGNTLQNTVPAPFSGETVFLIGFAKNADDLHLTRQFITRRTA